MGQMCRQEQAMQPLAEEYQSFAAASFAVLFCGPCCAQLPHVRTCQGRMKVAGWLAAASKLSVGAAADGRRKALRQACIWQHGSSEAYCCCGDGMAEQAIM
jgi:hypothetical protein